MDNGYWMVDTRTVDTTVYGQLILGWWILGRWIYSLQAIQSTIEAVYDTSNLHSRQQT